MNAHPLTTVVVALVAGVAGALAYTSVVREEHLPRELTIRHEEPPLEAQRALIDSQGGWDARHSVLELTPTVLKINGQELLHVRKVDWDPPGRFTVSHEYYRWDGDKLVQADVIKPRVKRRADPLTKAPSR